MHRFTFTLPIWLRRTSIIQVGLLGITLWQRWGLIRCVLAIRSWPLVVGVAQLAWQQRQAPLRQLAGRSTDVVLQNLDAGCEIGSGALKNAIEGQFNLVVEAITPRNRSRANSSLTSVVQARDEFGHQRWLFAKCLTHHVWVRDALHKLSLGLGYAIHANVLQWAQFEYAAMYRLWSFGVSVPRPVGICTLGNHQYALLTEYLHDARPLGAVKSLPTTFIQDACRQLRLLRDLRCAHGDLNANNVLLQQDGTVALVDLGCAQIPAGQQALDTDLANLLALLTVYQEPESVFETAREVFQPAELARAAGYLLIPRLNPGVGEMVSRARVERLRRLIGYR